MLVFVIIKTSIYLPPNSNHMRGTIMISCKNLSYWYETFEKQGGLGGTLLDLKKRDYKKVEAVKNISLQIEQGEIVGILGPNGAGKTTLIKMMTGILQPKEGEISCMGFYPFKKEKKYLKSIGVVMGQKSQLIWDLPAYETLRMLKEIYHVSKEDFEERITKLVKMLKVEEKLHIPVRKLSLGERVKFELICALLHSPKILFLDEPTLGLDVVSQYAIYNFLKEINQKEKTTILLTSHYMKDIETLANKIVIIMDGKKVKESTIEDLKREFIVDYAYIIETKEDEIPFDTKNCRVEKLEQCRYKLYVSEKASTINQFDLRKISSIREDIPELEEIIFKMFSEER